MGCDEEEIAQGVMMIEHAFEKYLSLFETQILHYVDEKRVKSQSVISLHSAQEEIRADQQLPISNDHAEIFDPNPSPALTCAPTM